MEPRETRGDLSLPIAAVVVFEVVEVEVEDFVFAEEEEDVDCLDLDFGVVEEAVGMFSEDEEDEEAALDFEDDAEAVFFFEAVVVLDWIWDAFGLFDLVVVVLVGADEDSGDACLIFDADLFFTGDF